MAQHETHLMRNLLQQRRDDLALVERRRERLLAEHGSPSLDRRGHDRGVLGRPRAHPDRVDGIDQCIELFIGSSSVRLRGAGCPGRVGVERRHDRGIDETTSDERAEHERMQPTDEPAPDDADACCHRPPPSGRRSRRAGSTAASP